MTDAYGQPAAPKKRNPALWIAFGCAILFFGVIAFVLLIGMIVVGSFRSSDPFRQAVRSAQNDPRVVEAIGSPIEAGWFVTGSIHTDNASGSANLTIPITGPKGKAKVYIEGTKRRGRWTYTSIVAALENGDEINLLADDPSPPEPPDTTPPDA